MARALQLAALGRYSTRTNPRVGCVIARDGRILGEGFHQRPGEPHAEILALQSLSEADAADLSRATAYVTLEPCAHRGKTGPCTEALIEAGVGRVVAAMEDPNPQVAGRGLSQLKGAGIEVASDLMADRAAELNPGFIRRMGGGRPWVRLKMAASLDGRTAMASGESQWITGAAARADGHRWRAMADAVITGVETVLADDPRLTPRAELPEGCSEAAEPPLRVVLDRRLRTPPEARLFAEPGAVLVFHAEEADANRKKALEAVGAQCESVASGDAGLDLNAVLMALAERGVNECHFECGARLAGSLLEAQLVDEMLYYLAPTLLGSNARPVAELPLERLSQQRRMAVSEIRPLGDDWRLILKPE
ncbi:MAG: bifunctional diaminohydroxyphosphoribosylaminopyrimidine deaminase/5-amino-6-(5-phosphoribosylamino)uracil reductase RibD [Pseudomonadota bacterium]